MAVSIIKGCPSHSAVEAAAEEDCGNDDMPDATVTRASAFAVQYADSLTKSHFTVRPTRHTAGRHNHETDLLVNDDVSRQVRAEGGPSRYKG
jgi:hypothetical protein